MSILKTILATFSILILAPFAVLFVEVAVVATGRAWCECVRVRRHIEEISQRYTINSVCLYNDVHILLI